MTNNIPLSFDLPDGLIDDRDFSNDWIKFYLKTFHSALRMPGPDRMRMIADKEHALSVSTECRMMNWDEVAECAASNVEIGSHTYSHDVLTEGSSEEMLEQEIIRSKIEIEQRTGRGVTVMALPNGKGSAKINEFVERAGFEFLLYVNDGVNEQPLEGNRFSVFDRINMVEEGFSEAVLRAEMFHARLRKYV